MQMARKYRRRGHRSTEMITKMMMVMALIVAVTEHLYAEISIILDAYSVLPNVTKCCVK